MFIGGGVFVREELDESLPILVLAESGLGGIHLALEYVPLLQVCRSGSPSQESCEYFNYSLLPILFIHYAIKSKPVPRGDDRRGHTFAHLILPWAAWARCFSLALHTVKCS